jgi:hypothetical protein
VLHFFRALLVFALASPFAARAASPAFDSAADPAYDDGWQSGDDGGTGWGGPWLISGSALGQGAFIGSSTTNGDGDDDQDGDIDTAGRAFGLFVELEGAVVSAFRNFDGSLAIGESFSLDLDNDPGSGEPGFRLYPGMGDFRFRFRYSPFFGTYQVVDADGFVPLGIPGTDEGLRVEFTLTGADTYALAVTPAGGATSVHSGTLASAGAIVRLALVGSGEDATRRDTFFNNLSVTPPAPVPALPGWTQTAAVLLLLAANHALVRSG